MRRLSEEYRADEYAELPSGDRATMWMVGVGLALLPICYGIYCIIVDRAELPGRFGKLIVTGSLAVSLAICYIAAGVFIHAHWFWGLHPKLQPYHLIPKTLALLAIVGGIFYVVYGTLVVG